MKSRSRLGCDLGRALTGGYRVELSSYFRTKSGESGLSITGNRKEANQEAKNALLPMREDQTTYVTIKKPTRRLKMCCCQCERIRLCNSPSRGVPRDVIS